MKGEYVEPKNENTSNMFSKLHHPSSPHLQNPFSHPFHQVPTDSQTQQHHHHHLHQQQQQQQQQHSEDDESRSSGGGPTPSQTPGLKPKHDADGASIEVVRRPRGRPPGSKNKPKPPVIITREPEPAMSPYILEVPGGNDVVEAISKFCRRKNTGLCVLTASGTVANVTLRQPSTTPGATVTFHGRFDILSVSATFVTAMSPAIPNGFTISLAGPQGQIVGGIVAGALIAAGTVYVVAASFNNPTYHRLPPELEDIRDDGNSPPHAAVSGGDSGQHAAAAPPQGGGESCGNMAMYSCHLPSDVIWAPTARPPPPPY